MKLGSLCSGAGGLDLAVEQVFGAETAWHCEIDDAAAKVLAHRWTGVPNHRDLTATDWGAVEPIDILTGGYPCQPFSHAGKRKGTDDERHIWPDVREAIRRLRPRYTFLENRRPLVPPRRWARCSPSSGTARRAALRTLRPAVRDRCHPRAVRGVPESAGGGWVTVELTAPFPYFGGKRRAAPMIWDALGDPGGYVEPFCGSAAALLARPPAKGRRVETINDADGWLVNAWRSIQLSPSDVAAHAHGPVTEIDYHARLAWLQERRTPDLVAWLEGDPEAHDAKAAAWWLYVCACGIGDPWGPGPWRVVDEHLRDTRHLGNAGQGVNRELPHLGNAGQGVNRKLPHLGDAGKLDGYMHALAMRLARVRITCGDWQRVLKPSVIRATAGNSTIGVLLDPPYSTSGDLYATTNTGQHQDISAQVREWATDNGTNYRIVLCGFDDEHDELLGHGWRKEIGRAGGGAGYNTDGRAGRRERLWLSPSCVETALALDFTEEVSP